MATKAKKTTKTAARKPAAKKAGTAAAKKKPASSKAAKAKTSATKSAAPKKAAAKKTAVKKTPAKAASSKTTAKKTAAKKAAPKATAKTAAKKAAPKKAAASSAKTSVKKAAAKAAPKKAAEKKTAAKTATKPAAKAEKPAAKKAAPKTAEKKPAEKKTPPAKAAAPAAAKSPKDAPKEAPKEAKTEAAPKPAPKPAAPKKPAIIFKPEESIVYPAHGVGKIVEIEEQEVAGHTLELFVISFEQDKMTLRVPTNKVDSVGMRKLSSKDVVDNALNTLKGRARVKRTMWSRRAQEYEQKINSGDLISIAEVVRDLFRSERQPEQSYSERQLYEAALDRMAREIAAVEAITAEEAVAKLEDILQKAAAKAKPQEAA